MYNIVNENERLIEDKNILLALNKICKNNKEVTLNHLLSLIDGDL